MSDDAKKLREELEQLAERWRQSQFVQGLTTRDVEERTTALAGINLLYKNRQTILAALRAVDALQPFADISGEGDEDFPDETPVTVRFGRTTYFRLRLGDLRRAALASQPAPPAANCGEEGSKAL